MTHRAMVEIFKPASTQALHTISQLPNYIAFGWTANKLSSSPPQIINYLSSLYVTRTLSIRQLYLNMSIGFVFSLTAIVGNVCFRAGDTHCYFCISKWKDILLVI
jgi:hypothetical protein